MKTILGYSSNTEDGFSIKWLVEGLLLFIRSEAMCSSDSDKILAAGWQLSALKGLR